MTTTNRSDIKLNFSALSQDGKELNFMAASSMTEEFRSMKRKLLEVAFDVPQDARKKNRIMITSTSRGEGKTFIAANLALSISLERGKNTLLVDTNVQHPSLSFIATPKVDVGLIDFLSNDNIDISQCIADTDRERLKLMAVGTNNYLANELLSSDKMESLMQEFNDRYDDRLVIFDAPHINGVNETLAIARNVDQIVVVVEEGKTIEGRLIKAIRSLPKNTVIHFIASKSLHVDPWTSNTPVGQ